MQLPALNLVSATVLDVHYGALAEAENTTIVKSLRETRHALDVWATRPPAPAMTVDLLGHSTRGHRLLRLGETIIDARPRSWNRSFLAMSGSEPVGPAMNAKEIVVNERDEEGQSKHNVATPSKQARLPALLFSGAALMAAVVFLEPKLPRWVGE